MSKILLAEDKEELLNVLSFGLKKKGFSVITARNGREAVRRFEDEKPDFAVLDYEMPVENGLEAASEILAVNPSAKIVMLTADYSVLKEAKRIGIDLFLVKPVSVRTLTDSLAALKSIKPFALQDTFRLSDGEARALPKMILELPLLTSKPPSSAQ